MNHKVLLVAMALATFPAFAENTEELQQEVKRLQEQSQALEAKLLKLQKKLVSSTTAKSEPASKTTNVASPVDKPSPFHSSRLSVHALNNPKALEFYPTALMADGHVLTYIAGTPVVTSPYLGGRPAFDGSDYIVNISSINRDIRLMQQRRRLYEAYRSIGYPLPSMPILALSGKVEPNASMNQSYFGQQTNNITLGSSELDVAAILNDTVEAYMSLAYDESPSLVNGQRLSNSAFSLNTGFVNIGNLDRSPLYFTAGQLFVPFGRFSSAMVSSPLTTRVARTKARPFILGYKSQYESGPFAAIYGYRSDTNLGSSGVGGLNLGYVLTQGNIKAEVGGSVMSAINDAGGMQITGSTPGTTFGGFASLTNGSESVYKIPAAGVHTTISYERYNVTAEWVGATRPFRAQDLSFNGQGAQPKAGQLEAGMTFMAFNKPASIALGYQWTEEALALNLPRQRIAGVFNISLWKDTVESLEYRHDTDYNIYQVANGASAPGSVNLNTVGTGKASDTLLLQLGVYF